MPTVSLVTPEGLKEAIKIPIVVPVLNITFGPTLGAAIELGFGFDTSGFYIRESYGTTPER